MINIRLHKNGPLRKKKTSFDKMNVDINIKVTDLILSNLLLSNSDTGLERFFRKLGTSYYNFLTSKMGVALHLSLQLANHKSQRSDFGVICKANIGTKRFHYQRLICFI